MVVVPVADVFLRPEARDRVTQFRYGEAVDLYDEAEGFAWVQGVEDGYVGYLNASDLGDAKEGSVTVAALSAPVYSAADMKSFGTLRLPHLSVLAAFARSNGFVETPLGWVHDAHLLAIPGDPVAVAERYLGVPYLWGGRSSFGLDCSALVQVVLGAAGLPCPRDSDMQADLGEAVPGPDALERGDLVFWAGHVGIMQSENALLHANAHHMAVASEPLADAVARIEAVEGKRPTAFRRVLPAGPRSS